MAGVVVKVRSGCQPGVKNARIVVIKQTKVQKIITVAL